jgi:peroxiredoxin
LIILAEDKNPESLALIRGQLTDVDPAVRVMALQQLRGAANSNDVPMLIRLLDDSDPRLIVQAASLLRKVTGVDSGIRASDALPNFARSEDGTPLPEPKLEAIQRGVRRWHEWWSSNRTEFSESAASPQVTASALPVKDFVLEDLDGRLVHLSDFRGKAVLLCFWKTGDARSSDDLAALKQLQEQQHQRLAVVGVAFDPSVGPQDDCEGEAHEHGQPMMMNGHMMVMDASPGPIESVVRSLVAREQIQFPVLLDKKGTLVFRYDVRDIPTYALLDAQGNLHRRFAGTRELPVWTAMIQELFSR